jgi:hypothetical protein
MVVSYSQLYTVRYTLRGTEDVDLKIAVSDDSERLNTRKGAFCVTIFHNGINGFLTCALDLSQSCRMLRSTGGMRTNSQPAAPHFRVQRTRA